MNDAQKFKKILEKAQANGFVLVNHKHFMETKNGLLGEVISISAYETIIFDKNFAKAFWGEEEIKTDAGGGYYQKRIAWQYHLQQLVLQDNYIDYLYSFITEKDNSDIQS